LEFRESILYSKFIRSSTKGENINEKPIQRGPIGSTSQRPIVGGIETISGNVFFFYRYFNLSGMKFFAELFTFSLILAGLSVLETYDALVAILKSLFLNLVNFFA